jgi:hypothetical protein
MRLTVNGVEVPIRDRLEITLEVDPAGETMAEGMTMTIDGGPVTFQALPNGAAFTFMHKHDLRFLGGLAPSVGHVFQDDPPQSMEDGSYFVRHDPAEPPKSWRELPPQI